VRVGKSVKPIASGDPGAKIPYHKAKRSIVSEMEAFIVKTNMEKSYNKLFPTREILLRRNPLLTDGIEATLPKWWIVYQADQY
jgi:hypothetical protein